MKKLSKVAALLAAGALFFGGTFLSCSSDGLPPELGGGSGSGAGGSGGAGGAGGSGGSGGDGTKTKLTAVADSWNFVSQADTVAWVASLPKSLSTDGTVSLTSNIDIAGADGKLTLSLLKENGIEKFSTALGANGNSDPSFSYVDPALGLRIKGSAIKIADVQGKIGLKIEWVGGASRSLGIYRGTSDTNPIVKAVDSTGTEKEATGNSGAIKVYEQDPIDEIIDTFLYEKGDLYIVAGNNIYIKSIGITNAGDAVTTVTLKVPTAVNDTTGAITWGDVADYDIGSTSITPSALETKIKAADNATITSALTLVKGALKVEAEAAGATDFTATNDMFDLVFLSEAPANAEAADTAATTGLETVTSNSTVYVWYAENEKFSTELMKALAFSSYYFKGMTTSTEEADYYKVSASGTSYATFGDISINFPDTYNTTTFTPEGGSETTVMVKTENSSPSYATGTDVFKATTAQFTYSGNGKTLSAWEEGKNIIELTFDVTATQAITITGFSAKLFKNGRSAGNKLHVWIADDEVATEGTTDSTSKEMTFGTVTPTTIPAGTTKTVKIAAVSTGGMKGSDSSDYKCEFQITDLEINFIPASE